MKSNFVEYQRLSAEQLLAQALTLQNVLKGYSVVVDLYNKHSLSTDAIKAYYLFLRSYTTTRHDKFFLTRRSVVDGICEEARRLRQPGKRGKKIFLTTRTNELEPLLSTLRREGLILKAPLDRDRSIRPGLKTNTRKKQSFQPMIHTLFASPVGIAELLSTPRLRTLLKAHPMGAAVGIPILPDEVVNVLAPLLQRDVAQRDAILTGTIAGSIGEDVPLEDLKSRLREALPFIGLPIDLVFTITTLKEHESHLKSVRQGLRSLMEAKP